VWYNGENKNQSIIKKLTMSHFSKIKTKITKKDSLIKALNQLGYAVQENVLLVNPDDHDHKQWEVEVGITNDVGFKKDKDGTFHLVAELDTWEEPFPVERFLEKVTQAYAKVVVVETVQEQGFTVVTESKSVDNTIEIVAEKW
tara:strand:- start:280 stop:708 length:429 start_codon:yes stop_codon:yes gene_type:complete